MYPLFTQRQAIPAILSLCFLVSFSINAFSQSGCLQFAHGPHNIIQNPPCNSTCGTPLVPGFEVFENEAYLINGIGGSEYTISFCNGYNPATWDAVITVGLSDNAGGAVPGSEIAFAEGCSLTFTTPTTDTYVMVISGGDNCGGPLTNTNNGVLSLDCGPNGAFCTPTAVACLDFAHGPHNIIQNPPCGSTCGTPLVPGFEVFENEAYLVNCIAGSEYTVSFCNGYNPSTWDAVITVGLYDGAGGTVQDSDIAFSEGCSLTFTTPTSDTYVIVISGFENCGGSLTNTNNGVLMIDCGPNGASCTETTSNEDIFLAEDIRIIPNPSMGDSRISLPEGISGEVLLKISDRTGKMVFQKTFDQISEGQIIVKESWLETGLYIVSLLHEGNVYSMKLVQLDRP